MSHYRCDMRCDVNCHHGANSRRSRCRTEHCDKQLAATSATGTLEFLIAPPDSHRNHAMVDLCRRGRKIVSKKNNGSHRPCTMVTVSLVRGNHQ